MKVRLLKKLRKNFYFYQYTVIKNTQYILKDNKGNCNYFPSLRAVIEKACVTLGYGELIFDNTNKKKGKPCQIAPDLIHKIIEV